jgi:hypothetical protein
LAQWDSVFKASRDRFNHMTEDSRRTPAVQRQKLCVLEGRILIMIKKHNHLLTNSAFSTTPRVTGQQIPALRPVSGDRRETGGL